MSIRINIDVDQGASFLAQLILKDEYDQPIDLSGYQVESMIRKTYTSLTSVAFDTSSNQPGVINIQLEPETTNAMRFGRYVYDLTITDDAGDVTRIIEGVLTLNPSVTR